MTATKTRPQERESDGKFAAANSPVTASEPRDPVTEKAEEIHAEPRPSDGELLLDEALDATHGYLSIGKSEAVALVLYAAATHAVTAFPAFGRLFMTSDTPESGKTTAVFVAAYLSANPENTNGSKPALTSMLAGYHNGSPGVRPTLYRDEISDVFGKSGLSGSNHPLANILREGYKRNATEQWSVNRVAEKMSIYSPFILAGNGTAIPSDVRSRCITLKLYKGRPELDLDSDNAEDNLRSTGKALGAEVQRHRAALVGYTCEDAVEGLNGRRHQVYRPLIAVAHALGGERWRQMALQAFADLTQTGKGSQVLSAKQMMLHDLVTIVAAAGLNRSDFIGGMALAAELSELPRFVGRAHLSLARDVARALPTEPVQKRGDGQRNMGHYVSDILDAWEANRPKAVPAAVLRSEANPYA